MFFWPFKKRDRQDSIYLDEYKPNSGNNTNFNQLANNFLHQNSRKPRKSGFNFHNSDQVIEIDNKAKVFYADVKGKITLQNNIRRNILNNHIIDNNNQKLSIYQLSSKLKKLKQSYNPKVVSKEKLRESQNLIRFDNNIIENKTENRMNTKLYNFYSGIFLRLRTYNQNLKEKVILLLKPLNILTIAVFIATSGLLGYFFWPRRVGNVAGVQEIKADTNKDCQTIKHSFDSDSDGLTDKEECELGTNQNSKYTCSSSETDLEVLLDMRNPNNCNPIDLTSQNEIDFYSKYITLKYNNENSSTNKYSNDSSILLNLFGTNSFEDLDSLKSQSILDNAKLKAEYIDLIQKIDSYVQKYRSYAIYDRKAPNPVHPAMYLEASLSCGMPVEYLLTIARIESNFGTNQYNNDGSLNRIGRNKNIFSFGLDDSGNNITLNNWEDVFPRVCKWYTRLKQKGLTHREMWKIYNPNGDYPTKVESIAAQIRIYLYS